MGEAFELVLFSTAPPFIREAVASGIGSVIVDWEHEGKSARQAGANTQINRDTPDDLRAVRACTDSRVICRLNGYGEKTGVEIERAIGIGVDELLLPMVRSVPEVEDVLERVGGRCGVGVLIETLAAVSLAGSLARLPLSRVYVGLNDLAIERGSKTIFAPLVDGTLEEVRRHIRVAFGFGGLTVATLGDPIPCRLLIGEMLRLECDFSFLRRSFHRDIQGRRLAVEVPGLMEAIATARARSPQEIDGERRELEEAVVTWPCSPFLVEEAP